MKLKSINEDDYDDIKDMHNAIDKYSVKKGEGNINKDKSEGDPDKTELPYRSGNQTAPATNDKDKLKLLGAADNSRDKQYGV